MSTPATVVLPAALPTTAEVAELLEVWASADLAVGVELEHIAMTPSPISAPVLLRLEHVLDVLRPAVAARARLACLPGDLIGRGLLLRRQALSRRAAS